MVEEKKETPPKPNEEAPNPERLTENAATSYGLEDHEATAQDPRVNELQHQQPRRSSKATTTPKSLSGNSSTTKMAPSPKERNVDPRGSKGTPILGSPRNSAQQVRVSLVEKIPERPTVTVFNPPPSQPPGSITSNEPVAKRDRGEKVDKGEGVAKTTNTDITFDPSKEYATKTTNTSVIMNPETGVEYEPLAPLPLSKEQVDDFYAFGVALVQRAGALALSANKERLSYTAKDNEKDLNTSTDIELEQMMTSAIMDRYPSHKIIAEQEMSNAETRQVTLTDDPTWVIDPIDGTMNFVHRFPYYCISVALFLNKETAFGIVFNPPLHELYTARKGQGAKLNDQPMVTSGQQSLNEAMVLQEYSSGMNDSRHSTSMENTKRLVKKTHALRSIGSSAMGLAMVASGVADAFYFFGLHVWDMAAGIILVTEAGGVVIDPAGGEVDIMSRRVLAAATPPLAVALSSELVQTYPQPRDDFDKTKDPLTKDFTAQTEFSDSSDELDSESSRTTTYHNAQ